MYFITCLHKLLALAPRTQVFVLLLRIVGMVESGAVAVAAGTLLCVVTAAVFVFALWLANVDRLNEQRAERRGSMTMAREARTAESSNDEPDVQSSNPADAPQARGIDELEAGPSRGRTSPREEEEKTEDATLASMPWSLLFMGKSTLCGAETADDDAAPVATGHAHFDELAHLALVAGVERSEISRLARAHSKHITISSSPPVLGGDGPTSL